MTEVGPEFDAYLIHTAQQLLAQEVQARGWNYDMSRVRLLARGSAWADLDGDGRRELCFTVGIPEYGGPAMCGIVRKRDDGQVGVRTLISCEKGLRELAIWDINRDGVPEIVIRWQAEFGLWLTLYVVQFDGTSVTSLFPNLRFHQGFMETKELDGDGLDEIVVWSSPYESSPRWGPQRFAVNVFRYNGHDYELQYQHRTERRYLPAEILQQRIGPTGLPQRFYEPPSSMGYRQRLEELKRNNQVDRAFVIELGVLASNLHREGFYKEALDFISVMLEAVQHLPDDDERHQFLFQTWETRGKICMWVGLWQEAVDSYLRALPLVMDGMPAGIDPVYGPGM
ncbi:MAG: hypothetical protein M3309_05945 [Actinomycetota bacterium]|nr:hypothetical protein [Actinomycetota bacterium]